MDILAMTVRFGYCQDLLASISVLHSDGCGSEVATEQRASVIGLDQWGTWYRGDLKSPDLLWHRKRGREKRRRGRGSEDVVDSAAD